MCTNMVIKYMAVRRSGMGIERGVKIGEGAEAKKSVQPFTSGEGI